MTKSWTCCVNSVDVVTGNQPCVRRAHELTLHETTTFWTDDDSVKLTHDKLLNYNYSHSNKNTTYTRLYSNLFMAKLETFNCGQVSLVPVTSAVS